LKSKGKDRHEGDNGGKQEKLLRRSHSSKGQWRRSPSANSPTRNQVRNLVSMSLAADALESLPRFSGGHKEFIDWEQAAQTLIDINYHTGTHLRLPSSS
jgi:hypothetical protein